MRALSNFEALYLARSANRLNEVVAQALAAGTRAPPAMGEGLGIARTAVNELDAARFDPLLVKGVARNVQAALDLMLSRMDPLVSCTPSVPWRRRLFEFSAGHLFIHF